MTTKFNEFLATCNDCGECRRVCPFLETYGTPDRIITEIPEKVFLCSNCKACDIVCKYNLRPSDALFEIKSKLLKNGSIPDEVRDAKQSAYSFAMRGHRFPFSYYPSTDTVFWPGCGLAGTSPEIVKKTARLLSSHLKKKVGLVLDCCFDPLYQLGDVDSVEHASEEILGKLKRHKISRIITGCMSCTKILSHYLQETKVEHILEILPEKVINFSFTNNPSLPLFNSSLSKGGYGGLNGGGNRFYLHHPCPSFKSDKIRQNAKAILQSNNSENSMPSCCGHGGVLSSLYKDLSEKFAERVMKLSNGSPIVTYCMGCKGMFLQRGRKAHHLLEFITGVKPIEKPVTSTKKWINRFSLSVEQRMT